MLTEYCILPTYSYCAIVSDFRGKSGKHCKIYTLYAVYQYNNIVYISSRKRNRNKINILSDSRFFVFHLVSSLALGRIQSAFQSSFPIIDLLSEECRSVFHRWIVAAKRKKDGLWSLPHISMGTCVLRKGSHFYKIIGIWKGKCAYLNIVYFDLAYIRLMHKLNWIFNPFPLPDDSSNIQPKEKKGSLHIFFFRCSFCFTDF